MSYLTCTLLSIPLFLNFRVCEPAYKILDFWEDLAARMGDRMFRRFFRMRIESLQALVRWLKPPLWTYKGGRVHTSPDKMVAMTVYWLGNESAYKHILYLFGVTEDCFINCTEFILNMLIDKSKEIIKPPTKEELPELAAEFNEMGREFYNTVGSIDGMHVRVAVGSKDKGVFYNYKSFHSVHLKAICDAKRCFWDVFAGFPGCAHSATVFRDSPVFNELDALLCVPRRPLEDTYHIMADSVYPGTVTTVATFKLVGLCNNPRIKKFNTHLASKRNVIERAFTLLVSRWCHLLKLRC